MIHEFRWGASDPPGSSYSFARARIGAGHSPADEMRVFSGVGEHILSGTLEAFASLAWSEKTDPFPGPWKPSPYAQNMPEALLRWWQDLRRRKAENRRPRAGSKQGLTECPRP